MTDRPVIVTARLPKRIRRRKAAPPLRIGPIVGARKAATPPAPDAGKADRAEAAERLWQALVRKVKDR